jgi:hypothetical protein
MWCTKIGRANGCPVGFLNTMTPSGLPSHRLNQQMNTAVKYKRQSLVSYRITNEHCIAAEVDGSTKVFLYTAFSNVHHFRPSHCAEDDFRSKSRSLWQSLRFRGEPLNLLRYVCPCLFFPSEQLCAAHCPKLWCVDMPTMLEFYCIPSCFFNNFQKN